MQPTGQVGDAQEATVLVAIRVTPAAARTSVGGSRGDALVIRVTEAAVDGRATRAALDALAHELGVSRVRVQLRRGATSREKLVAVTVAVPAAAVEARLAELRARSAR